ncbi:1-phosphofructokinase family hexose kinase [Brevibacterium sp. JSBI002]|uniref:1-phosphofructokinase family hexose kinase n=1 Tax=Brevibacterium sp. JSBI002 TaxID=2886045 RepID=UPI00222E904B|nr:1-phosphofructokinase family hexose kinase [Brevibacterium sp. JSBI002]UZD61396.1 1-phosphofructokinase family hexose kinase [Brevibacterium sp. JSBI002]
MILTLTANPSLDRTIELSGPVLHGQVQRAVWAGQQPGGKGVNVSRAVAAADRDTLAVLPGDLDDPVLTGLDAIGLAHRAVPTGTPLRSNITVTEPDGTTTKINEPGSPLSRQTQNALLDLVAEQAVGASWVVLAGSLPPGVDDDFYARVIKRIRQLDRPPLIAVDTSGAPLAAALMASPDLIKPNAEELAELLNAAGLLHAAGLRDDSRAHSDCGASDSRDAAELHRPAEPLDTAELHAIADRLESSPQLAARATSTLLNARGPRPRSILATLGAGGAVLAQPDTAWHAQHPPMEVVSTVGAGDSTLAGYLLGLTDGREPDAALARAVAYGAAAARLRGTGVPSSADARTDAVTVMPLETSAAPLTGSPTAHTDTHTDDTSHRHEGTAPEAEEAR